MLKLVRRKGKPTFYVRGAIAGRPIYESTKTTRRAEAQAYLESRQAALYKASLPGQRRSVTFSGAVTSYLEFEPRSERTGDHAERLHAHFGMIMVNEIDQDAADAAVAKIVGAEAAPATKIRAVYGPLTAILTHAQKRGWCDLPNFDKPRVPRAETRWLTPAEALRLIAAASPHLAPLLIFLLSTGARLSEALDLAWPDVDLAAGHVMLRGTKNGRDRKAGLPAAALVALANLPGREGRVFRRGDGEPYVDRQRYEGGQIKTGFAAACRRAGIVGATPHDLRHTWATWFYALTKDLLLVKDEGGWRTLAMVERYAHLLPSALIVEIAAVWGGDHPRIGAKSVQPDAATAKSA